jgi:hypothetical protein
MFLFVVKNISLQRTQSKQGSKVNKAPNISHVENIHLCGLDELGGKETVQHRNYRVRLTAISELLVSFCGFLSRLLPFTLPHILES